MPIYLSGLQEQPIFRLALKLVFRGQLEQFPGIRLYLSWDWRLTTYVSVIHAQRIISTVKLLALLVMV
jgi:hypothetical protein